MASLSARNIIMSEKAYQQNHQHRHTIKASHKATNIYNTKPNNTPNMASFGQKEEGRPSAADDRLQIQRVSEGRKFEQAFLASILIINPNDSAPPVAVIKSFATSLKNRVDAMKRVLTPRAKPSPLQFTFASFMADESVSRERLVEFTESMNDELVHLEKSYDDDARNEYISLVAVADDLIVDETQRCTTPRGKRKKAAPSSEEDECILHSDDDDPKSEKEPNPRPKTVPRFDGRKAHGHECGNVARRITSTNGTNAGLLVEVEVEVEVEEENNLQRFSTRGGKRKKLREDSDSEHQKPRPERIPSSDSTWKILRCSNPISPSPRKKSRLDRAARRSSREDPLQTTQQPQVLDLTRDDDSGDDESPQVAVVPVETQSMAVTKQEEEQADHPTTEGDVNHGSTNGSTEQDMPIHDDQSVPNDVSNNDDLSNNDVPSTVVLTPEVKAEMTRKEALKNRETVYGKYKDRFLLDRHSPLGVGRLGGGVQDTHIYPSLWNKNIWDDQRRLKQDYPFPRHLSEEDLVDGQELDMSGFRYHTFNERWNVNAPKYAGQPFAAVTSVAGDCKSDRAFPVFVRRARSKTDIKTAALLGWEYCGNYKAVTTGLNSFWESAENYPAVSRELIAGKVLKSSESPKGYGRRMLEKWKKKLAAELEKDDSPAAPEYMVQDRLPTADEKDEKLPSMAARARALGLSPKMSDEAFVNMLVRLDEYHEQIAIQFVEYDERIYEWCSKGGKTSHDAEGKLIKNTRREPAKAGDWYSWGEQNMLM
jgi:hypothetical protein